MLEGTRKILEGVERELEDARSQGDASAAASIAGRKALIEEVVALAEQLANARANAEKRLAEAEAAGAADAVQNAKERLEDIQVTLRALLERDH